MSGAFERHNTLCTGKVTADIVGSRAELFLFMVLTREALYNAHSADVFLNGFVQSVILAEYRTEGGHCLSRYHEQSENEHGYDDNKGGQRARRPL